MQIIINAGGSGTRLWPLSTKSTPKQFAKIIDNESLLQKTYFRLAQSHSNSNIWVTTNSSHAEVVKNQLGPNFIDNNILTEPQRRDTFAAVIAHAAIVASRTNVDETLVYISSDHYIDPTIDLVNFDNTLQEVDSCIQSNQYPIVLPATKPYFASPAYGYIKFDTKSQSRINPVLEFKEKPNLETAKKFLESGQYYWNLGYFAFKYSSLLSIINEYYPETKKVLDTIYSKGVIELEDYEMINKESFDFAILEKIQNIGVIDMKLTSWDDIGNFDTVYNYLPTNEQSQEFIQVGGDGNKIKTTGNKKIAFVGVSNLMFVESEHGTMIIDPTKSNGIKDVAAWFDK
jgi:mannose-1-phosphate guanylyltransferase